VLRLDHGRTKAICKMSRDKNEKISPDRVAAENLLSAPIWS